MASTEPPFGSAAKAGAAPRGASAGPDRDRRAPPPPPSSCARSPRPRRAAARRGACRAAPSWLDHLAEAVEGAAQAGVDGAARHVERAGDLAGGVVEQEAE